MSYLIDSNILVRLADRADPQHVTARSAVRKLVRQNAVLVITLQNCAEFWTVATRPRAVNGLALPLPLAGRWLDRFERAFTRMADAPDVYDHWRRLLTAYLVSGVQVHDARLAASMLAGGVTHVLTFNKADFLRFVAEGIVVVDPADV